MRNTCIRKWWTGEKHPLLPQNAEKVGLDTTPQDRKETSCAPYNGKSNQERREIELLPTCALVKSPHRLFPISTTLEGGVRVPSNTNLFRAIFFLKKPCFNWLILNWGWESNFRISNMCKNQDFMKEWILIGWILISSWAHMCMEILKLIWLVFKEIKF